MAPGFPHWRSIEFPTQLAVRIGGGAEWNRRVMYRAIREGYVKLYRRKHKRHTLPAFLPISATIRFLWMARLPLWRRM